MTKPRNMEPRTHTAASETFRNILHIRSGIAKLAGLEYLDDTENAIKELLSTGLGKNDPVTNKELVTVKKSEPPQLWSLRVALYNGHFIEIAVTFRGTIKLLSTIAFGTPTSNGRERNSEHDSYYERFYDAIALEPIAAGATALALVMHAETEYGVFVKDVIQKFLEDARNADECKEPEACQLCNHANHDKTLAKS